MRLLPVLGDGEPVPVDLFLSRFDHLMQPVRADVRAIFVPITCKKENDK